MQVCATLDNPTTQQREVNGLHEALMTYKLEQGLMLTLDKEGELSYKGKKIIMMPVWKWLLKKKKDDA